MSEFERQESFWKKKVRIGGHHVVGGTLVAMPLFLGIGAFIKRGEVK